jgi:hypothetical protein
VNRAEEREEEEESKKKARLERMFSAQQGGAHRQRDNAQESGAPFLFLFLYLNLRFI